MNSHLRNATFRHYDHAYESADNTKVAARHEGFVRLNLASSGCPESNSDRAERKDGEAMEPGKSTINGIDTERSQNNDIHTDNPCTSDEAVEGTTFATAHQLEQTKDK